MIPFIVFSLFSISFGIFLVARLFPSVQLTALVVTGSLFGILLSINLVYCILASKIVSLSLLPFIFIILSIFFCIGCVFFRNTFKQILRNVRFSALSLSLLSLFVGIAAWLTMKSFRGDVSTFLIGSNEVFDFGHSLSIIRSMSWGDNVPFLSPFVSGTTHLYYFMFYFWVSLFERSGIPIVYAMNIPSILSFAAFFIMLYLFTARVFNSRFTGIIAVLFVLFHSNLTFIFYFIKKGISISTLLGIWRNSTYLFNGPDDGSRIILGRTMNAFTNQRHFAFSLAVVLSLFLLFEKDGVNKKLRIVQSMIAGIVLGNLLLWHATVAVSGMVGLFVVFLLRKRYRDSIVFLLSTAVCAFLSIIPWVPQLINSFIPYVIRYL